MTYPQSCYAGLLGINGACTVPTIQPQMFLDMIPSVTIDNLAKLSNLENLSGEKMGISLIETASRFVSADVLSIYDAAYKIVPSLVSGCSACTFTANSSSGAQLGTMVKNQNTSRMARLVIKDLVVKLNATGTYTVVMSDGVTLQTFQHAFTSGVEAEFQNLNFSTRQKTVRIYTLEPVEMPRLSCPAGSGCGCSGRVAHQSDLVFTGTAGGAETSQAYGFLPCAYIGCSGDDVLCSIAQQAPVMVAQTMLYKVGELYHQMARLTTRNNRVNVDNPEAVYRDERHYAKLYSDKLKGVGTRGLKDVVNMLLQQNPDACVTCDSKFQTAWATG
jgi:hypothetical protein